MTRRGVVAGCVLVAVAAAAYAQSKYQPAALFGDRSKPLRGMMPGLVFTDTLSHESYVYIDTSGVALGALQTIELGHNDTAYVGFLQMDGGRMMSDTTTGKENGYFADGVIRVMKITGTSTNGVGITPNCTSYVFSDQDTILKLVWNGNRNVWDSGDSGSTWIADSSRVVIDSSNVLSVANVAKSVGPQNPNQPHLSFYLREEIKP